MAKKLRITRTATVIYEVDVANYGDDTPEEARLYELELEGNDLLEQFVEALTDPEAELAFSVQVFFVGEDDEPDPGISFTDNTKIY